MKQNEDKMEEWTRSKAGGGLEFINGRSRTGVSMPLVIDCP